MILNHVRAPIFDALVRLRTKHISFHVPGHKDGHDFDHEALSIYKDLLTIDQTEIEGLDDLHHASGIIAEAETLAADAFGSEQTKFLVGGTTVGVLALIMGTIQPGESLLIQRNSHKSIFNGVKLAKGKPVFVHPDIDAASGIPKGVSPEQIKKALENNSNIRAVFLTSPNYYGQSSKLKEIADIVHHYDLPLFVDEAHGAHFAFHKQFPATALEQGADAVVQSIHKTLPAMTMASMLHYQGNRVNRLHVNRYLSTLQSSSPSYPLLASLDLARRHMMVGEGKANLTRTLDELGTIKNKISSLPWVEIIPTDDPLRLVLVIPLGLSNQIERHLQSFGIFVEIVEANRLVLVLTGGNQTTDLQKLWHALEEFQTEKEINKEQETSIIPFRLWTNVIRMDNIDGKVGEWVPLIDAVDRISGEMITPYPPGIPLVMEGQIISREMVYGIKKLIDHGIYIQGIHEGSIYVY